MDGLNEWWGYKHVNGNYQVKRFFDDKDLEEARESPFTSHVSSTFWAKNREDALKHIKKRF